MPAKQPAVTLERIGSHSVIASQSRGEVDHEEVYFYFHTTWQGKPVAVTMEAKRYATRAERTDALTWHEWRVFASDCRYIDADANARRGEATTPTARTRLADVCRPIALAWLNAEGTTQGYWESRQLAFRNLAKRLLSECRPWEDATRSVRAFVEQYSSSLYGEHRTALLAACDAYDAFSEAFRAID